MGQKNSKSSSSSSFRASPPDRAAAYYVGQASHNRPATGASPLGGAGGSLPRSRRSSRAGSNPGTPKLGNSGHGGASSRLTSRSPSVETLRLEESCRYLLAAGALVHALQAERGASTIYAASKGNRAKGLVERTRSSTDAAMARLRKTTAFRRRRMEDQLRADLAATRTRIEPPFAEMPHSMVADIYEALIERLLNTATWVREMQQSPEVEDVLSAYIIFARIKEGHGRLRGRIGGILASGNPSLADGHYQKLIEILGQLKAYTNSFRETVPSPFRPLPQKFLDKCASIPKEAKDLQKKLMTSQAETEAMLATMSPEEWYAVMTARMDSMDEVQGALAMEIRSLAQKSTSDSGLDFSEDRDDKVSDIDLVEGLASEYDMELQEIVEKEWHIGLEHLQLQTELGRGISGTVYLGEWEQQEVAVKIIQDNDMSGGCGASAAVKEFCREVQVLSKLRHPNVCTFLGANISPPRFCMVLEYMDGGTLWETLRKRPENVHFMSMSVQLARGMKYLHEKGEMIHRDLKSPNILLNSNGQLKIVDFGLTLMGHAQHNNKTAEVGTLRWMAPEVMTHQPYSYSADVYSFGIILWELLTKDVPWRTLHIDGRLPPLAMFQALQAQKRPIIPSGTPKRIRKLVTACWHPDPESRPTFGEILTMLEEASVLISAADHEFLNGLHIGGGMAPFGSPQEPVPAGGQQQQQQTPALDGALLRSSHAVDAGQVIQPTYGMQSEMMIPST